MTALHLAAKGARIGILEYLVVEGADVNIQDHNKVPRHSRKGAISIFRYLLLMPIDRIMSLCVMYLEIGSVLAE